MFIQKIQQKGTHFAQLEDMNIRDFNGVPGVILRCFMMFPLQPSQKANMLRS